MGRPLTTQLDDPDCRPYFLWDEDTSNAKLREVLRGPSGAERDRLLGKMLREARDIDVWTFVSPADVAEALPRIQRRLYVLADLASALGAQLSVRQDAPGFRRVVLMRGEEGLVVDLVIEQVHQAVPDKPAVGGVKVESKMRFQSRSKRTADARRQAWLGCCRRWTSDRRRSCLGGCRRMSCGTS